MSDSKISFDIDESTIALSRRMLLSRGHCNTERDLSDEDIGIILSCGILAERYPALAKATLTSLQLCGNRL